MWRGLHNELLQNYLQQNEGNKKRTLSAIRSDVGSQVESEYSDWSSAVSSTSNL